ncbi:target of Nesh-SH3 isoform X2 [Denticeps clupeoides]|uniref:target of Nesh-SH3 isoform X2 n=1 Tax=Denticeps clupeoides TaxID=299321 RepID=UPI0010A2EFCA|nr:target of Nesh-SH3-like isoform X2 [Denticeps clupeoides]
MLLKAFVLFLFLAAGFFCASSSAQMTRVRRENMKVEINATEDTIVLKFIRPRAGTRLEGYILGYGGSMFSKQYIQLPQDGKTYHGEMDAEPKYLISVVPARGNDVKEECRDKVDLQKPLHLVIGSVTPTSVMLSWGTLLKTPFANADEEDCPDHELYTVRYREQEEERKWNYQSCPTSTTVVDHLKPNTPYEFGVRAHSEEGEGAWTPPVVHNTNTEFEKSFRPPVKPIMALPKNEEIFSARPVVLNRTLSKTPIARKPTVPPAPRRRILDSVPTKPLPSSQTPTHMPRPTATKHTQHTISFTVSKSEPHDSSETTALPTGHSESTSANISLRKTTEVFSPDVQMLPTTQGHKWPSDQKTSTEGQHTDDKTSPSRPVHTSQGPVTSQHLKTTQSTTASSHQPYKSTNKPVRSTKATPTSSHLITQQTHSMTKESPSRPDQNASVTAKHPLLTTTHQTTSYHPQTSTRTTLAPYTTTSTQHSKTSTARPSAANLLPPTALQRPRTDKRPPNPRQRPDRLTAPSQSQDGHPFPRPETKNTLDSNGEMKMAVTRTKPRPLVPNGPPKWRPRPKETNQVPVPETKRNKGPVSPWKQVDPEPVPKPTVPAPPVKTTSAPTPTMPVYFNGSRFEAGDNSSVFRPVPVSEVDAMGKKRFTAPHVVYITDKRPEEPCSVTQSLSLFPNEEPTDVNITGPPRTPPSNVTVVTVEGCSSFVIIDWEKSDNETTEYEVISKATTGQNGDPEVSVQTTNQTHTAVENLKPESSYEFTVKPKNELGSGPASEPVTFSTESADPRVTEERTGKDAIWSTFPFKMDLDAECNGRQYVKRTWYRKFVGIQLCNSLRYKIYLSDSLRGPFYHIGDQVGNGEDHCQFVDSFLDGRTGSAVPSDHLPATQGFFRAVRQEPVYFGEIGGNTRINYVSWYECGVSIPGKW